MKKTSLLPLVLLILCLVSSCKVGRFVVYNFADINDHKKFPSRDLQASMTPFVFQEADKVRVPAQLSIDGQEYPFEEYLEDNKTVAFLIIQGDTIQYERYWGRHDQSSIVPSFSMAKSVTSILIGCAIDDGLIGSVQERVTDYLPEFKESGFDQVTIEHLLQMTSSLEFNESYINPFGDAATFYYGRDLRKSMDKLSIGPEPGVEFNYESGTSQLLGMILDRVLKDKTITDYLQERLWTPLQMEYDASWSLDRKKDGLEKTFCCLNARARDFAKIGRLYMNKGKWGEEQIVSEQWVERSTRIDTTNGSPWYYQYQWWIPTESGDFMAQGILGQYIYVAPDRDLIIVRLGKGSGKADWWQILSSLGENY